MTNKNVLFYQIHATRFEIAYRALVTVKYSYTYVIHLPFVH